MFSTPYLCDDCYAQETESTTKAIGCVAKLFIGILTGLAMMGGVFAILAKIAGELSNSIQVKIAVGVEVFAIVCFIASKVGSRNLGSKFLRFICGVVAYFMFWMSLVFGVGMYFMLKYGI